MKLTGWDRLERYAKWKGRFRWVDFPDDVLTLIVSHLTETEVLTLVRALAPENDAQEVPKFLRDLWIRCVVFHSFRRFVYDQLAEVVLYHARDTTSCALFADWSCFSPEQAPPLVEFAWVNRRPQVVFHEDRMMWQILVQSKKRLPTVRLTVHEHRVWGSKNFLDPEPLFAIAYPFIPNALLRFVP